MPSNDERSSWARTAVLAFGEATGQVHDWEFDDDTEETVITDLLTNLHHLTDTLGLDWDALVSSADVNYAAEATVGPFILGVSQQPLRFAHKHAAHSRRPWECRHCKAINPEQGEHGPKAWPYD